MPEISICIIIIVVAFAVVAIVQVHVVAREVEKKSKWNGSLVRLTDGVHHSSPSDIHHLNAISAGAVSVVLTEAAG